MREQDRQPIVSMVYAASVSHLLIRSGWNYWLYVIGRDSDEKIVRIHKKMFIWVA